MGDILNPWGSIWYHSKPSYIPNSPNQFLGWDFFADSYSKTALIAWAEFLYTYKAVKGFNIQFFWLTTLKQNSPILKKSQSTSSARTGTNTRPKNGGNGRRQTGNGQKKSGNGRGGGNKQNRRQQQSNQQQQRRRPSNKNTSAQGNLLKGIDNKTVIR